ncbi:hypothetical protein PRZ48_007735 [Zasmidium cellare]|uniref:Ribosomal protein L5 n=1 Tax=Zasmidium cellare TaxID=395010 RepID=A0ABR0EKZ5_ZASCE|nr:hypothetical protein PRZ48_007735 [Zasmidium cellare]
MALQEVTSAFIKRMQSTQTPLKQAWKLQCLRTYATDPMQKELGELEESVHQATPTDAAGKRLSQYDPTQNAKQRKEQLPPSRYQFRSPRFYRGPLHPHQPLKSSDPASREFVPGPFTLPRLQQTYESTIAPDLMTLTYQHYPPGFERPQKGERLREWVGDSPYFKNRPRRGPRGYDVLPLLRKPITFRNVPKLERVTVHTMLKGAADDSAYLHVAGMVVQNITNVRVQTHAVRKSVASFGLRAGKHVSVTSELYGENMYHFLSKVIDVVMPKIKDYKGVKGSSGDSSGHISFGFKPEEVALFPEVEVNYDMYPPKMIPGLHVTVHTSATTDYDARMLLQAIGVPFYGKMVD